MSRHGRIDDGVLAFDRRLPDGRVGHLPGMGIDDKAENKTEDLKGRAKEAAGSVTGNDDLKNEGRADQAESSIKQAGEKVKDAVSDVKDAFKK